MFLFLLLAKWYRHFNVAAQMLLICQDLVNPLARNDGNTAHVKNIIDQDWKMTIVVMAGSVKVSNYSVSGTRLNNMSEETEKIFVSG